MSMFDLNAEELEEAKSGGFPTFTNGSSYTFLIEEVKDNSEKERIEVKYKITSADQIGKAGAHFFFYKNKKGWINFLGAFFTEAEMLGGNILSRIPEIIGTEVTSVCKKNEYKGKMYDNFYSFERKSNVPEGLEELTAVANEAVSKIAEQADAGQTVF